MTAVETWAFGYAVSRGYARPEPAPVGLWMSVGRPEQAGRYVFRRFEPAVLSAFVRTIDRPAVFIEVCGHREAVAPLLPKGWVLRERAYLMTLDGLGHADGPSEAPGSYRVATLDEGEVVRAEIRAESGEIAAGGRCALVGASCVFDQILTQEDHRRRGLGRAVMRALARRAAERGAGTGILIATPAGRALYRALGWTELSEVTSAISPGAALS